MMVPVAEVLILEDSADGCAILGGFDELTEEPRDLGDVLVAHAIEIPVESLVGVSYPY